MQSTLRVALGHQARVGKDTFANYVSTVLPFGTVHTVSIAKNLYAITESIQRQLGVKVEKDPALLQQIGTLMRKHYGEDVWINGALREIGAIIHREPYAHIIVTDMRYKNEFKKLKEWNFETVKITRAVRPMDRDPNHPSEVELADAQFDHTFANNGTEEEFCSSIHKFLQDGNIIKPPTIWRV